MPKILKKKIIRKYRFDKCSNPHNVPNHSKKRGISLRKISKAQLLAWNIPVNDETLQMKICASCRSKNPLPSTEAVSTVQENMSPTDESSAETTEISSDTSDLSAREKETFSTVLTGVNDGLHFLGVSPIQIKKVTQTKYSADKIDNISNALRNHIFNRTRECSNDEGNEPNNESNVLKVIQEKFSSTTDRNIKIQILTIIHQWSYSKIKTHFPNATRHMIEVAKKIAVQKGILEGPNPKSHPSLEDSVINKVLDFYQSDEYSRLMPGQRDYVSVKIDGVRNQIQKRLLLLNLKELYCAFKNSNPEIKCSFSKFAYLRPKQCILAGARGTHSVCVCAIHENVKLLIDGVNLHRLSADRPQPLKTYHGCLNRMICNPATTDCYIMETCSECPGINDLIQELEIILEENCIDQVTYKQWTNVDRSTLETMVTATDEFLEILSEALKKLLRHSFLVRKQNEFLNFKKESLKAHECIVMCDFSENYAFVIQNAIQGFHWNNDQATIHPTAIYYKDENNILQLKSLVSISECLNHDTVAVYLFQSKIVEFINQNLPRVTRIVYFSEGASAQYKNRKNFINLSHHIQDFKIGAEWHFFPTSHGKRPCDGLGGTLKRLAARASLQRIDNLIRTPLELFKLASIAQC